MFAGFTPLQGIEWTVAGLGALQLYLRWMSNATQCRTGQECPDAQLCHEGQCQCAWRYGLTGDACDQWTARAVWRVTGQALCLLIYLAAGMHAYMLAWRDHWVFFPFGLPCLYLRLLLLTLLTSITLSLTLTLTLQACTQQGCSERLSATSSAAHARRSTAARSSRWRAACSPAPPAAPASG